MFTNVPTSYKSPYWRNVAKIAENEVGIPSGLLVDVMTKGEKSNANQVSSAGAKTPFQIIPATRDSVRKIYGVDAYSNPRNAAKAAALLLKESLKRNNGDVVKAVAEYHGGTDTKNWGPITHAYVQRVTGNELFEPDPEEDPYAEFQDLLTEEGVEPVEQRTIGEELLRQGGLTVRAGAEGVAGLFGILYDPIASIMNLALPDGYKIYMLQSLVSKTLTDMGVPEPETQAEKFVNEIGQVLVPVGGQIGATSKAVKGLTQTVGKGVAKALAAKPAQQAAGAVGAVAGTEVAEEAGGGPLAQMGGGLVGSVVAPVGGGLKQFRKPSMPKSEAADIIQQGADRGVPVLTSDVKPPKGFLGKNARRIGASIVGTGTSKARIAQENARKRAIRELADDYGASPDALEAVADNLGKTRSAALTKYTALKTAAIANSNTGVPVSLKRTIQEIDDQIAALKKLKTQDVNAAVTKLDDWKNALQGQDIETVEILRKQIGETFKAPELAAIRTTAEKSLAKIYKPLVEEMGEHIQRYGKKQDYNKWRVANARLKEMVDELDAKGFKNILKNAESSPEVVARLLLSKNKSDLVRLKKNLGPDGIRHAKAAIVYDVLKKSGGYEDVSSVKFTTALDKISDQTGIFFSQDEKKALDGFVRLLKATRAAPELAAAPATGVQNLPSVLAGLGLGFGSAFNPVGGVSLYFGTGAFARLYESSVVRNTLMRLSKSKPGTKEEAFLVKRLMQAYHAMDKEIEQYPEGWENLDAVIEVSK